MKSKTRVWLVASTLLLSNGAMATADDRPTAEQLLLRYEQSVRRLSTVHIESVEKTLEKNNLQNGGSITGTVKSTIFHDDWRWKIKRDIRSATKRNDTQIYNIEARAEFVLGDRALNVSLTDSINGKLVAIGQGGVDTDRENPTVRSYPGERVMEDRVWSHLNSSRILFGRLPGVANQPLWQVMREADSLKLRPESETVGKGSTWVLESRGKFGEYTIWFDAEHLGVPRKIEVGKTPDDLYDALTLKEVDGLFLQSSGQARKPRARAAGLKEWTARIDDVRIETHDGVPVIVAFKFTVDLVFEDGRHEPDRCSLRVDRVDFDRRNWPENAFDLSIEVPDRNPVTVYLDAAGKRDPARYEWWKGKIRKKE